MIAADCESPSSHDLFDNSPIKSSTTRSTSRWQSEEQEVILLKRPGETPDDILRSFLTEDGGDLTANSSSLLLLDLDVLVSQWRNWKKLMPRVMPYYAVKCNPTLPVLRVLAAAGVGFDCASKNELLKVCGDVGVPGERVIYANTVKDPVGLQAARELGVELMTFDALDEVDKVKAFHPNAKLVLRIRCNAKSCQVDFGDKFGVEWHEVEPLLRHAHALGVAVVGVSFHVGSDCRDYDAYRRAIDMSRRVFDLAKKYDFTCNLLDIGGGFPGSWRKNLTDMAQVVNSALETYFPETAFRDLRIISEPGRYFACRMGTAALRVIGTRTFIPPPLNEAKDEVGVRMEDEYGIRSVYVNNGVYGFFVPLAFDFSEFRFMVGFPKASDKGVKQRVTLYGPTCAGHDCLGKSIELNGVVEVGDWIFVGDMGAYPFANQSDFNGMERGRVLFAGSEEALQMLSVQQPSAFWI